MRRSLGYNRGTNGKANVCADCDNKVSNDVGSNYGCAHFCPDRISDEDANDRAAYALSNYVSDAQTYF